ncbi:MAG: RsmE family RNA methyltransferase, partial [Verrucomicrobiota bacterium]
MGQLHRFFQESLEEGALILGAEEGHHCAKVLRHRVGDAIELFDGRGCRGECVITHLQGSVVTVECKRVEERTSVPHPLVLAQAIPKGKTMDWIVQRAVELGVQQIIPLRTERTASSGASGKVEKWRKVALEACKQCCQDWLPVISEVTAFDDFVRNDEALGRYAGVIHPRAQPLHD